MTQTISREYVFDLSGGRLCLDFVNTVSGSRAHPRERLNSYHDLVSWGRQAGALTEREAQYLAQVAKRRPAASARSLAEAVRLREALFRLFSAMVEGRPPQPDDLAILNATLAEALANLELASCDDGYAWAWEGDADALDRMLWPVVRSATDLLTSPDRHRIHICESTTCDWLFMDMSRNHSRRWCDMKGCGNRAKARRYYERHKAKAAKA